MISGIILEKTNEQTEEKKVSILNPKMTHILHFRRNKNFP